MASVARGWCDLAINGIIAKVLISRPIHAINQCELAKVNIVPRPMLNIKILSTYSAISEGRILTNILGVWARELY